jgi:hypothetical protein
MRKILACRALRRRNHAPAASGRSVDYSALPFRTTTFGSPKRTKSEKSIALGKQLLLGVSDLARDGRLGLRPGVGFR